MQFRNTGIIRSKIPIKIKKFICEVKEKDNSLKLNDIRTMLKEKFNIYISKPAISRIIKRKNEYLNTFQQNECRIKSAKEERLEKELFIWFKDKENNNLTLTENLIIAQAIKIATKLDINTLKFSRGWLQGFKRRYGIRSYSNVGNEKLIDIKDYGEDIFLIKSKIKNYSIENVFNFDETALFYQAKPLKSLNTKALKNRENYKKRLTVGLCCNATGYIKLKPIIVNNVKKPRDLKNFDFNNLITYYSSNKGWMTSYLFRDFLLKWDISLNTKILLILDNCPSHDPKIQNELKNIELLFLPKSTTSYLHPLDKGIIHSFKCKYKRYLLEDYLNKFEENNFIKLMDIKTALILIKKSWDEVSIDTIKNCFSKTSLIASEYIPFNSNDFLENIEINNNIKICNNIIHTISNGKENIMFEDYLNIEDDMSFSKDEEEIINEVFDDNLKNENKEINLDLIELTSYKNKKEIITFLNDVNKFIQKVNKKENKLWNKIEILVENLKRDYMKTNEKQKSIIDFLKFK